MRGILSGLLIFAASVAHGQLTYTNNNGALTITGYTGPASILNIPSAISVGGSNLPVVGIAPSAFADGFFGTVTIPGSVTNIGDEAFLDCGLLHMLIISNGVTTIGTAAFEACPITSILVPGSVTSIGDWAFALDSSLGSLTISSGVSNIGAFAFSSGTLNSVMIPGSVTNIGPGAFCDCPQLSAISLVGPNAYFTSVSGILFNKNQTTLLEYPMHAANNYTIPNGVTSIADFAFYFCSSLQSVAIPATVTNVGTYAFAVCHALTNVTIPGGVTSIGDAPFAYCGQLAAINVNATNANYISPGGVLFDKNQDNLIQFPGGLGGSYAIPSGVQTLGDLAFVFSALTNISIPASVTNIGTNEFYFCRSLTSIAVDPQNSSFSSVAGVLFDKGQTTLIQYPGGLVGGYSIPNGVTAIANGGFNAMLNFNNTNLTSLTIPGSLTTIASDTFIENGGLKSVVISNGVTDIVAGAFEQCGLTNLVIPASVTNIDGLAFFFCQNLRSVFFEGNAPTATVTSFSNDPAKIYYLPGATGWSNTFANLTALLWNPHIQTGDGSFGISNQQFGFNITGTTNIPIVVEAATNLSDGDWTRLQSLNLTNGIYYFSDPQWTNYPGRFYQIVEP